MNDELKAGDRKQNSGVRRKASARFIPAPEFCFLNSVRYFIVPRSYFIVSSAHSLTTRLNSSSW
jgi:hypothetical protein